MLTQQNTPVSHAGEDQASAAGNHHDQCGSMNKHAGLRLTANLLPIVLPFMAKDDIRCYLNSVNVRPHKDGGAVISATNGHILGVIYDPDSVCEHEVNLRLDEGIRDACASKPSSERMVVMRNGRLTVVDSSGLDVYVQSGEPEVGGDYPRIEKVVPRIDVLKPGLVGTYAAPLLALVKKAVRAASKARGHYSSGYSGLQFFNVAGDVNDRVVVRMALEPNFVGMIMPMKVDAIATCVPEWMGSLQEGYDAAAALAAASEAK